MHDTIDADPTSGGALRRSPSRDARRSSTRSKRRANGCWRARTTPASGAASSRVTRRSRAISILLEASWAAGTASDQRVSRAPSASGRCRAAAGASTRAGPPDLSVSCLSYFALKVVGRRRRRAAHARRARRDPRDGRRGSGQHVHAVSPGAVRAVPVGGVAGDPARDDLPARPWRRSASTTCRAGRGRSSSRCRSCGRRKPVRALPDARGAGSCFTARPAAIAAPAPRSAWGAFFSGVDRRAQGRASAAGRRRAARSAPSTARPPG